MKLLKMNSFTKVKNTIAWRSPSNIALIKYWGKENVQLPINPSISFSLSHSYTDISLSFIEKEADSKEILMDFLFESKQQQKFENRIRSFLNAILTEYPFLSHYQLHIESSNSFPHSAGIASSASSMSALALCIVNMKYKLQNRTIDEAFYKEASYLARLASGSASRSVYGDFVSWGKHNLLKESSDLFAKKISSNIHPVFKNLQDSILLVSAKEKKVSSSTGHQLMENHPYKTSRIAQANENFSNLLQALKNGNWNLFAQIVENEALSLHALMMSSMPGFMLMKAESIRLIERIQAFREKEKTELCFTLDAGPNIHLIYPEKNKKTIEDFIKLDLENKCEKVQVIFDELGSGPIKLTDE